MEALQIRKMVTDRWEKVLTIDKSVDGELTTVIIDDGNKEAMITLNKQQVQKLKNIL